MINDDEHQIIQHSQYYDNETFKKLTIAFKHHFSILSLNIQSVHAKFYELEALIEEFHNMNMKFTVICLQDAGYLMKQMRHLFKYPAIIVLYKERVAVSAED